MPKLDQNFCSIFVVLIEDYDPIVGQNDEDFAFVVGFYVDDVEKIDDGIGDGAIENAAMEVFFCHCEGDDDDPLAAIAIADEQIMILDEDHDEGRFVGESFFELEGAGLVVGMTVFVVSTGEL